MLIIGELINSSRKSVAEFMTNRDGKALTNLARQQMEHGADYIDINCSVLLQDEKPTLLWMVELLQSIPGIKLSIDSPNTETLIEIADMVTAPLLLNSVTSDNPAIKTVLSVAKEKGAKVIGLCMSGGNLPGTVDETKKYAVNLLNTTYDVGFPISELYLDPLVRAVATDPKSAATFLDSLSAIKSEKPESKTICGLSNISFGMPGRKHLNRALMAAASMRGLDAAILDPNDKELIGIIQAGIALSGSEDGIMNYISEFRAKKF